MENNFKKTTKSHTITTQASSRNSCSKTAIES